MTIGPPPAPCRMCGAEVVTAEGKARCVRGHRQRERRGPVTEYRLRVEDCTHQDWSEGPVSYVGGLGYRTDTCLGCGLRRRTEVEA